MGVEDSYLDRKTSHELACELREARAEIDRLRKEVTHLTSCVEDSNERAFQACQQKRDLQREVKRLVTTLAEREEVIQLADSVIYGLDAEIAFVAGAVSELTDHLTDTGEPKAYALVRAFRAVTEQNAPTFHEATKLKD